MLFFHIFFYLFTRNFKTFSDAKVSNFVNIQKFIITFCHMVMYRISYKKYSLQLFFLKREHLNICANAYICTNKPRSMNYYRTIEHIPVQFSFIRNFYIELKKKEKKASVCVCTCVSQHIACVYFSAYV